MATYTSTKKDTGQVGRGAVGVTALAFEFDVDTALAAADVIQLFDIPEGAVLIDLFLDIPDLDTNGTPTIELDVGDTADVDRYIDGETTVGQSAGFLDRQNFVAGAIGYEYTADDIVQITVVTGAATGATGVTIKGVAVFTGNP